MSQEISRNGGKMECVGFEHLHLWLHTDFSLLDGYGLVEEYANRAVKINQKFLTVSDHGMMGAIPRQIRACEKASSKVKDTLSPIFACELYVNSMQPECSSVEELQSFTKNLDEVQKKQFRASSHLLAIAYNEVGYKNLVRLTFFSNLFTFNLKVAFLT